MKKKSLPQKIMQLLRKRSRRPGGTTVKQVAKILRVPKELAAKAIFLLFAKNKLEIYAEFVELKKKKSH